MKKNNIKIGDKVRHNSGGPEMTVVRFRKGDGGVDAVVEFPVAALTVLDKAKGLEKYLLPLIVALLPSGWLSLDYIKEMVRAENNIPQFDPSDAEIEHVVASLVLQGFLLRSQSPGENVFNHFSGPFVFQCAYCSDARRHSMETLENLVIEWKIDPFKLTLK
jgi:hypothetical protein